MHSKYSTKEKIISSFIHSASVTDVPPLIDTDFGNTVSFWRKPLAFLSPY